MLIFYQLLTNFCRRHLVFVVVVGVSSSLLASRLLQLVAKVGILPSLLYCRCHLQCPLLWLRPSASAPCRCQRLIVVVDLISPSVRHWEIIYGTQVPRTHVL